jgi:hypothetical protein
MRPRIERTCLALRTGVMGTELLRLPGPPTRGVYAAAWRLGLRIPDDLSVVGFDDIENTRWCCPPMTTVRQPLTEMGAAAARTALTDGLQRRHGNAQRLDGAHDAGQRAEHQQRVERRERDQRTEAQSPPTAPPRSGTWRTATPPPHRAA